MKDRSVLLHEVLATSPCSWEHMRLGLLGLACQDSKLMVYRVLYFGAVSSKCSIEVSGSRDFPGQACPHSLASKDGSIIVVPTRVWCRML